MAYLLISDMNRDIKPIMKDIICWFDTKHIVVPEEDMVYTSKFYNVVLEHLEKWTRQYAKSNVRMRVLDNIDLSKSGSLDKRRVRTIYNTWYNVYNARIYKGLEV